MREIVMTPRKIPEEIVKNKATNNQVALKVIEVRKRDGSIAVRLGKIS
jgi:hypothetical protein